MPRILLPVAALAVGSPAWALDCAAGIYDADPANGEADVPVDAVLVFHRIPGQDLYPTALLLEDGAREVPVTVEATERLVRVEPVEDLALDTTYRVEVTDGVWGSWSSTFRTGDRLDTEPPAAPEIRSLERVRDEDGDWGEISGIAVALAEPDHLVFWEVQVALVPDFADAASVTASDPYVLLGRDLCDATFPAYDPDRTYYVRVRAIDRAGNDSDWVQRVARPLPGTVMFDRVGGCSTAAGFPNGVGALAVGWMALAARRRAPRRCPRPAGPWSRSCSWSGTAPPRRSTTR